jgi:cellulose synthase/poly-beta-1,6-N-acetylglucosamine synthase-like glycosyltransferase
VESGCGAVTCLPGALTMLRFSAFRKLAKFYFADKAEQCEDHFDYWKNHLGEDRFLTHLFMIVRARPLSVARFCVLLTAAYRVPESVTRFR